MRLFAPLCTTLLTITFCLRAAHAQDSPIIINDNGNVPLTTQGQINEAALKAKKKGKKTPQVTVSLSETHINSKGGIQYKNKEYFVELPSYQAVCLDTPDGNKIYLVNETPWRLTTQSILDNAVIRTTDNKHIHIDPGKTMKYRPPNDMDDVDPTNPTSGKKNQLIGGIFNGHLTNETYNYNTYKNPFIIHYCGGATGCVDDHGVDQCPNPPAAKK
jgi:hypothetical protein